MIFQSGDYKIHGIGWTPIATKIVNAIDPIDPIELPSSVGGQPSHNVDPKIMSLHHDGSSVNHRRRRPMSSYSSLLLVVVVVVRSTTTTKTAALSLRYSTLPPSVSLPVITTATSRTLHSSKNRFDRNRHQSTVIVSSQNGRLNDIDADDDDGDDSDDEWRVGNVHEDFDNLERAMMYRNAESHLLQDERLEALDHLAQQRIPISIFIRTKFVFPLLVACLSSYGWYWCFDPKRPFYWGSVMAMVCHRTMRVVSGTQFISVVMIAPILLLLRFQCLPQAQHPTTRSQLPSVDSTWEDVPTLHHLIMTTSDARGNHATISSTRDYVKCLLEQWMSCIFGMMLTSTFWLGASLVPASTVASGRFSLLPLQLLTRLGVMASLQQYQSQWFALIRSRQPRPLSGLIWMTQTLALSASNIWFATLDVISLSILFPAIKMSLPALLASCTLLWYSVILSEQMMIRNKANSVDHVPVQNSVQSQRLVAQIRRMSSLSVKAFLAWSLWSSYRPLLSWIAMARTTPFMYRIPWLYVASFFGITVAVVGPICHLVAMLRLISISYYHNASLSMNSEQFEQATANRKEKSTWKWRYKLRWREPQRVNVTLKTWWNDFWYSLFLRGSVDEKLRQDRKRRLGVGSVKARGLTVLQRVAAEHPAMNSSGKDRAQWKINAMNRLAQKHQEDYSIGSYDDPLGVAVYRTLGIGLGFNFDHMNTMNSTKPPSLRRLQARAAKSAIHRVNHIYNAERAANELNQITDPLERQKRASDLQQEAEMEVKKLADRLIDLVPTDLSWDEPGSDLTIQQFQGASNLGSLARKFRIPSIEVESSALRKLFDEYINPPKTDGKSYEIDYLNPMGADDLSSDDEFLIEWLKQNEGTKAGNETYSDDGENLTETILV